ncbi:hypothetical protein CMI42_00670 [Candidatus Pacearchaeota archaeon]|nr:hypothetical protein [Candidatus Pacearchaeota archaeon]|tara:strand:- start:5637 stop:6005 length:369 start_codon:yes stop_codon:yes gene_type:complete
MRSIEERVRSFEREINSDYKPYFSPYAILVKDPKEIKDGEDIIFIKKEETLLYANLNNVNGDSETKSVTFFASQYKIWVNANARFKLKKLRENRTGILSFDDIIESRVFRLDKDLLSKNCLP